MADLNNTIVRGKLRVTEDINTNGNIVGSSIIGSGSGLTNLNASNISSGTLNADRLDTSGAKAGSYGLSDNATPAYGAKFNVPYITIDNKGRVTAASTKTVTIPASDNTDTKNTAGSTNNTEKLYLVGAKSQATNPQTYSNSSVYMTGGTLYANALNTGDIVGNQVRLRLQNPSGNGTSMDAAYFDSSDYDEPILGLYGHLAVYGDSDSSTNPNKPANQTAITDLDTDYFNTGIALKEADDVVYKLSFPGKSGTFALTSDIPVKKYKHNIVLSGSFSAGPGGTAYCTFSFTNNGPSAISTLSELDTALAARFTDKICPACGLFGYSSSGTELYLITGITYDTKNAPSSIKICVQPIARTFNGTMTVSAAPNGTADIYPYAFSSATIADTVEEC